MEGVIFGLQAGQLEPMSKSACKKSPRCGLNKSDPQSHIAKEPGDSAYSRSLSWNGTIGAPETFDLYTDIDI